MVVVVFDAVSRFFFQMMNSNGNCRGSMSPSSNTGIAGGGGPPGGIHLTTSAAAAAAAVAVAAASTGQAVQGNNVQSNMSGGGGGGLGVGINNDGLSSSYNPAMPLAGVYSPKTSHLSIVQQQLEQVNFVLLLFSF